MQAGQDNGVMSLPVPDAGGNQVVDLFNFGTPDPAPLFKEVVTSVLGEQPVGMAVLREQEYARRAEAPTLPELMSAAEIADELGVSRQRVHQLRENSAFPAPLAELRGGAVWDAHAVRAFGRDWERKPGRPRAVSLCGVEPSQLADR